MKKTPSEIKSEMWDVIVIGGGVIGCAMIRHFALMGAKSLLLERGPDILSGASKANSALLHTGFDAPPHSLELSCIKRGYQLFLDIKDALNLPLLPSGAFVVAWTEAQLSKLPEIVAKAHENGVMDVAMISPELLYQREPNLNKGALGAVEVPGEAIIDPWSSPLAYLTQAVKHGAEYYFNCEVQSGNFEKATEGHWELMTNQGQFKARVVINCAGINGDTVETIAHPSPFTIKPRKGQFLVLDKSAASLVSAIILPVPTEITKGVLVCKTIFGNILVGPTAEEQENRWEATVDEHVLGQLLDQGAMIVKNLKDYAVTATYAGLRPATEYKDYQIKAYSEQNWIGVGGIRSTGLTSALGVAEYVYGLYEKTFAHLAQLTPPTEIIWPRMPNLAEHLTRDYQQPDNGGVVCHCEWVTEREIEAAFASDIPPESLGGLRRRTRAMMGRCNGFYCSHKVTAILDEKLSRRAAENEK